MIPFHKMIAKSWNLDYTPMAMSCSLSCVLYISGRTNVEIGFYVYGMKITEDGVSFLYSVCVNETLESYHKWNSFDWLKYQKTNSVVTSFETNVYIFLIFASVSFSNFIMDEKKFFLKSYINKLSQCLSGSGCSKDQESYNWTTAELISQLFIEVTSTAHSLYRNSVQMCKWFTKIKTLIRCTSFHCSKTDERKPLCNYYL